MTQARQWLNGMHAAVFLAALLALMGAVGWLIWGPTGFVIAGFAGALLVMFRPGWSASWVMKWFRGRELTRYDAPEFLTVVAEMARRAGLPSIPRVFVVPSADANAFAVGSPSDAAIGVTQGLLAGLDRRELVGVLAHEVGHIAAGDLRVMSLASAVVEVTRSLSFLGQILLLLNLPYLFLSGHGVPWLVVFLLMAAPSLGILLQLGLSRTREFQADAFAARLTGDPLGLASALMRLDRRNVNWLQAIVFPQFPRRRAEEPTWLRSHPQTAQRVNRLKEMAKTMMTHGDATMGRPMRDGVWVPIHRRWSAPRRVWMLGL